MAKDEFSLVSSKRMQWTAAVLLCAMGAASAFSPAAMPLRTQSQALAPAAGSRLAAARPRARARCESDPRQPLPLPPTLTRCTPMPACRPAVSSVKMQMNDNTRKSFISLVFSAHARSCLCWHARAYRW